MVKFDWATLGDAVKVAVGACGVLVIDPWLSTTLKLPSILAFVLAAAISALIVSFSTAIIFARPRISLAWSNPVLKTNYPDGTIDIDFRDPDIPSVAVVQLVVLSRSFVSDFLLRFLRGSSGTRVEICFEPAGALWFTPEAQFSHQTATVDQQGISYELNSTGSGPWSWARFTIEPGGTPSEFPVRVSMILHNDSAWKRAVLRYVHRDVRVSTIRTIR